MSETDLLRAHSMKGKKVRKYDQGNKEQPYCLGVVEDEVSVINEEFGPRKIVIQRICEQKDGAYTYRLCYLVINGKGGVSFGQYAPMLNGSEFGALISQAINKGWIKPDGVVSTH
jgi:hypothetical protein